MGEIMLIAIFSVVIALVLRKAGVNIPYFDNVLYAAKTKLAEFKYNKELLKSKTIISSIKSPNLKINKTKLNSSFSRSLFNPYYKGKLKI